MNESERCPECGGVLKAGSGEGLCARCLLAAALLHPPPTAPENLPAPGQQIGTCRIVRLLGDGGTHAPRSWLRSETVPRPE